MFPILFKMPLLFILLCWFLVSVSIIISDVLFIPFLVFCVFVFVLLYLSFPFDDDISVEFSYFTCLDPTGNLWFISWSLKY